MYILLKLIDLLCCVKAKSAKGRETVRMNKYPHHLGSGGYEGKKEEWAAIIEKNRDSDSPLVHMQCERGQNWFMGRAEIDANGRIVLPESLRPVAQKMVRVVLCYNFVSFKSKLYMPIELIFLINSRRWRRRSVRVPGL